MHKRTATGPIAAISRARSIAAATTSPSTRRSASPQREGFVCLDHSPGQAEVERLTDADSTNKALRAAKARNDAELDLGLPERGLRTDDDEIARERELAAPTEREAVDRGDDGHRQPGDAIEHGLTRRRERLCLDRGHRGHRADVCASDERLAAFTGEDEGARAGVGADSVGDPSERLEHRRVERVERLRAVDLGEVDATVEHFVEYDRHAHAPYW